MYHLALQGGFEDVPMDLDYSTYYSDQPRLPVEIIARIIEESKDDRETLRQFALVSSACLKYARQNIFHTVTLDSEARVSTLHNVISIAPEIVRSIRTVHFSAYKHYMARHKTPPPDLQRWIPQAVATLAQALTNVTAVHFDYIQWDTLVWSPDAFAASLRLISAASEVKFRACNFGQFSQFERILTGLPAMKRLILNSVQWKRFDSLPERYTLSMNTLQVVFPQVPNTLRPWLSKINALTTLRGLEFNELQVHHEDDLLEAGRFLGFMGASLRNLTIGCAFSIEGYAKFQDIERWLPLKENTGLEVLHIRVSDLLPGCTNWVLNLLHAIDTENLHTLVFELWLVHPGTLEEDVWREIAWMLSEPPRFSSLQCVKFIHRGALDFDVAVRVLLEHFSFLDDENILEFENQRPLSLYK